MSYIDASFVCSKTHSVVEGLRPSDKSMKCDDISSIVCPYCNLSNIVCSTTTVCTDTSMNCTDISWCDTSMNCTDISWCDTSMNCTDISWCDTSMIQMDLSCCETSEIHIDLSGVEYNVHTTAYKCDHGFVVETEITSLDSCGNTIVDIPIFTMVTDEIPESTSIMPVPMPIPPFMWEFTNEPSDIEQEFMEFIQAIQSASSQLRKKITKFMKKIPENPNDV